MYSIITLFVLAFTFDLITGDNVTINANVTEIPVLMHKENTINTITDTLIRNLGVLPDNNERLKELKAKLYKIDEYLIDKDKFARLLINETEMTELNATNFYKALIQEDHLDLNSETSPMSLYLKLKSNLNRDDVLKIVSNSSNTKSLAQSARKAMGVDVFGLGSGEISPFNDVVDKYLAEVPNDIHKYEFEKGDAEIWDPQQELTDLQDFHNHDGRRIYKGERTTIRYYPFMVSIQVMGRFWCGGVLYKSDLVLTSAACLQLMHNNRFFRENPKILSVRVGSNHSRLGGEVIEALEVYFHPSYSPKTLKNNIAVIRLLRQIRFTYHRIPKSIQISLQGDGVPNTAEVLVLGWGVTKHDAGGPAVMAGKLVGIISFGPSICGFPNAPTVFTLVGAFADWIETIEENMPTYYKGKKRTTTTTERTLRHFQHTPPKTVVVSPYLQSVGGESPEDTTAYTIESTTKTPPVKRAKLPNKKPNKGANRNKGAENKNKKKPEKIKGKKKNADSGEWNIEGWK